jgi:hypothetical protein
VAVLLAAYWATASPGVTFWDSGEFIAAMASWGIPHPPATPLYVTIGRSWVVLLGMLPVARAATLLSGFATALAAGALALLVARVTKSTAMAFAAAICAGGMSTVWSSATETEAYATALLLAMAMLLAAERAGATRDARWLALTAYAMALAVPIHLSALVAAPAAIVLAAYREEGGWRWDVAALLGAVFVIAAGVGRANELIVAAGAAMFAGVAAVGGLKRPGLGVRRSTLAVVVAFSACLIILLRARQDPALNFSDPRTLQALWGVIGRRIYGSFALWPRNAPVWLQLVNFLEYADWQVALSLAPRAAPAVARTAITVLFIVLGVLGASAHRRLDRRSWLAFLVLFLGASLGLVMYLNFYPGYSLGYGILPPDVRHEVRERDYFFVLAFWMWGAWAGIGAVSLARKFGSRATAAGVALAAIPLVLNFSAMDRARSVERDSARVVSRALLWGAPKGAVLLTMADDDTFLSWYAQIAERERSDLIVLNWASLYDGSIRARVARRYGLVVSDTAEPLHSLDADARRQGRALAPTVVFGTGTFLREIAGGEWMLRGLTFVRADSSAVRVAPDGPLVDTLAAGQFVREFGEPALPPDGAIDGTARSWMRWVRCPAEYLKVSRKQMAADSLDSPCKFR